MRKKLFSLLALLCITASSAWADVQPTGSVSVYKGCKNAIYVAGTASDADIPGQSITVHVYANQGGVTKKTASLVTDASSGRFAGFVTGLEAGNYDVVVYALNNSGSNNPTIGTQSGVTVISTNATQPTGDINDCSGGNGSAHFSGWSFDYDAPAWSPRVYIYYRTHGSGAYTALGYFDTTIERADVNKHFGITGNHGFDGYLPVAAGTYDFQIYWQNNSGADNPSIFVENITVSAPFAVTYNANGGSGSVASQDKRTGIGLELSDGSGFTKTGYTLDGWATSADGAVAYDLGGTYTANEGATLYAHWTPTTYNVTANSASEAYWATFYSNAGNYQAPDGTQVFTVSLAGTGITMNEVGDRIAKSGEGVVLKKTTTGNFTMTLTETAPAGDFSSNSLDGTMTLIETTGANNYYVLGGKNGAGFYKLSNTSGTIGANKAYLTYSDPTLAREFFLFDEATGIEMPTVEGNDFDGTVYDLQGRRVQNPTKGLYIVNGKKVFINN